MKDEIEDFVKAAFEKIDLPSKDKLWATLDKELDKSANKVRGYGWLKSPNAIITGLILLVTSTSIAFFLQKKPSEAIKFATGFKTCINYDFCVNQPVFENNVKSKHLYKSYSPSEFSTQQLYIQPEFKKNTSKNNFNRLHTTSSSSISNISLSYTNELPENNYSLILMPHPIISKYFSLNHVDSSISYSGLVTKKNNQQNTDSNKTPLKLTFNIKAGIAFNNFTLSNKNINSNNLFSFGFEAGFNIKNNVRFKTGITYANEAIDIVYYTIDKNNFYKADQFTNSKNILINMLYTKTANNWHFDAGVYTARTIGYTGNTTVYGNIESNYNKKEIDGVNILSSEKLDAQAAQLPFIKRMDYGLQFGIGYNINKISIGLNYVQGLRDYMHYTNFYKGYNVFNPHRNAVFCISYRLN